MFPTLSYTVSLVLLMCLAVLGALGLSGAAATAFVLLVRRSFGVGSEAVRRSLSES